VLVEADSWTLGVVVHVVSVSGLGYLFVSLSLIDSLIADHFVVGVASEVV
jgi:hypothetical protein